MKNTLMVWVLLLMPGIASACNICSCTSMGNSLGILPQFRSHFVGLRTTYRSYLSEHPASLISPEGSTGSENYYNQELWGRWYPHPRVQVFGFLPYNMFYRQETEGKKTLRGLGDASLLANYLLLNTSDSSGSLPIHALLAGGGIKLASGRYDNSTYPGFQLGTGSYDLLMNLSYTLRYQKAGLSTEAHYRLSGANRDAYRYGDRMGLNTRLFYWLGNAKHSLLPYGGMYYEQSAKDRLNGKIQNYSGGHLSAALFGADYYRGRFQLGFNVNLPLRQNLSDGLVTEKTRLQFSLIYHFRNKKQC